MFNQYVFSRRIVIVLLIFFLDFYVYPFLEISLLIHYRSFLLVFEVRKEKSHRQVSLRQSLDLR